MGRSHSVFDPYRFTYQTAPSNSEGTELTENLMEKYISKAYDEMLKVGEYPNYKPHTATEAQMLRELPRHHYSSWDYLTNPFSGGSTINYSSDGTVEPLQIAINKKANEFLIEQAPDSLKYMVTFPTGEKIALSEDFTLLALFKMAKTFREKPSK